MADYSTYLTITDVDEPHSQHANFVHEQLAIYDSCTNYFAVQTATPVKPLRQVEWLQRKQATQTCVPPIDNRGHNERTPLLKTTKSSSTAAQSVDSVYESPPKKSDKRNMVDVWFTMYLMFYMFYLVLGSVAFEFMEGENEIAERDNFREVRQRFLQKYSDVLGKKEWELILSRHVQMFLFVFIAIVFSFFISKKNN